MKIAEIRKVLIAVATLASSLLAQGLLPSNVAAYVATAIAALGTLGVYVTPNAQPAEGLFVTASGTQRVAPGSALAAHLADPASLLNAPGPPPLPPPDVAAFAPSIDDSADPASTLRLSRVVSPE